MNLPLNIDIQQILLHMLNFVILSGGLYFILYKPVKDFMDERKKVYENMDIDAKKACSDAENAKKEYEEKLKSANNEISKIKEEQIKKAENEAKEIVIKAQNLAQAEKQESIKAANKEISKLAVEAAKKVVFQTTKESID